MISRRVYRTPWLSRPQAAEHLGVSDTTLGRGIATSIEHGLNGTTVVDVRSGPERKHRWMFRRATIDAWWASVMTAPPIVRKAPPAPKRATTPLDVPGALRALVRR